MHAAAGSGPPEASAVVSLAVDDRSGEPAILLFDDVPASAGPVARLRSTEPDDDEDGEDDIRADTRGMHHRAFASSRVRERSMTASRAACTKQAWARAAPRSLAP